MAEHTRHTGFTAFVRERDACKAYEAHCRKRLREELHILFGPAEEAQIDRLVEALEEFVVAVRDGVKT